MEGVWAWVRYELLVFGVAALVVGSMAFALRDSVKVGPQPEWDGGGLHQWVGAVTAWSPGQSTVGGWVENRSIGNVACPNVYAWVDSGDIHGHLQVTLAQSGPLMPGEREVWTGTLLDDAGHQVKLHRAPDKDYSFACIWPANGSH